MNPVPSSRAPRPGPELWEDPVLRAALGARDVTAMYRRLHKLGYAQQKTAALTGQSQPEVSAIIHGRKVVAYDVLDRIVSGLGAPRGVAGMAYTGPVPLAGFQAESYLPTDLTPEPTGRFGRSE